MKLFTVFIIGLFLLSACSKEEEKIIYFVRHAEKDLSTSNNPDLSVDGVMRSVDLKSWFNNKSLDSILSTQTNRTLQTVQPLAEERDLSIGKYDAKKDTPKMVASYKDGDIAGDTVLICGHSNTILEQIEAFGAERPQEKIDEQEYDKIFELQLPSREVIVHQYGSSYKN